MIASAGFYQNDAPKHLQAGGGRKSAPGRGLGV